VKWRVISLVLVLAMAFTLVGPAFADGGDCIGGKCDADAVAVANVDITIDGPGKVYVGEVANFTVTVDFNSFAWAEAYAKGLIGYTEAYAGAYADGLAYGAVYDPSGNIIASQFSLEGDYDWDYDWDWGWLPYAEANAYAEFPETVVFNFGVMVTEEGEWAIYAYADSIAAAFSYGDYWTWWFYKYCEAYGFDFDWDEAWLYFLAVYRNFPHMRLDVMLDPGCRVKATAYGDWANGRLGGYSTESAAYLQEDPYIPGGWKYVPATLELNGGVVYEIKAWCPDGRDIIGKADFHIGRVYDGYQKIWAPFHNQAPGVFNGLYVTGGLD